MVGLPNERSHPGAVATFLVALACSPPSSDSGMVERAPLVDTRGWSTEKLLAYFNALRGDAYPLDEVSRRLAEDEKKPLCEPKNLQVYRGTHLKVAPLSVHPALVDRIERFERVAQRVGLSVYGRAPTRLRHVGGYSCRSSRLRPGRISEHALGNAIDIVGFDFPALPKSTTPLDDAPGVPRGAFQITVQRHWVSKGGASADLHQQFLRRLTDEVVREAIFRVLLGPSHPGHHDHFHFDMSPWRYRHL